MIVFVLQTRITLPVALPPLAQRHLPMDHQLQSPSFWRDKRTRWVARAQTFSVATATSAVKALNEYISSAPGALSNERVERVDVAQGADGLFAWTASSLSLLRQMNEDTMPKKPTVDESVSRATPPPRRSAAAMSARRA